MGTATYVAQAHIEQDQLTTFFGAMTGIQIVALLVAVGLVVLAFISVLLAKICVDIHKHERREQGKDGENSPASKRARRRSR